MRRLATMGVVATLTTATANAQVPPPLDLSKQPLFLARGVEPNLFLTLDDSNSMARTYIPDGVESRQEYWSTPNASASVQRCGWQMPRFYSSSTNKLYYNPAVTYLPPLRSDGTRFPNANFNAAWLDGISANTGGSIPASATVNLATQYFPTIEIDRPLPGQTAPQGNEFLIRNHLVVRHDPVPIPPLDNTPQGACADAVASWTLPYGAGDATNPTSAPFYYEYTGPKNPDGTIRVRDQRTGSHYTLRAIPAEQRQNFANWYSYYRSRSLAARSALSVPFSDRISGVSIAWQNLNQNVFVPGTTQLRPYDSQGKVDLFAWLYGHRLTGQTPTRAALKRTGDMLSVTAQNRANPFWDVESSQEVSCRVNYHALVTDGYWNESNFPSFNGTHDRQTLSLPLPHDWVASQYPPGTMYGPNQHQSQRIFWNESTLGPGGQQPPAPSLADLAFHYWSTDARTDLKNDVPARWSDLTVGVTTSSNTAPTSPEEAAYNPEVFFNPANDPARHQHLVNYAISFGVSGQLPWPSSLNALRTGQSIWPAAFSEDRTGIDDLWHATVNSRGGFYVVNNPAELSESLGEFLDVVNSQRGSSAAATVSSGVATSSTLVFKSGYDTTNWTGYLEAYEYSPVNAMTTPVWRAEERLLQQPWSQRKIFTLDDQATGIPFRWNRLDSSFRTSLNRSAAGVVDGLGEDRLEYLRGDRSNETGPGAVFRRRDGLLGAIVHSSSVFVGAPSGSYSDEMWPEDSPEGEAAERGEGYASFVQSYKSRTRQVIVSANDGMVHAFDAGSGEQPGTGEELWAYLPRILSGKLSATTVPSLSFEPLTDASVSIRDVFLIGRGWRTVLVGGLRRGGQGFFALDITTPRPEENDAEQVVLWERSDADNYPLSSEIGFTYHSPNISRLAAGWVAVASLGYNSHQPDANTGSGRAGVAVLSIDDGSTVRTMQIDGVSGLGPLTMLDHEGDGIDDAAVAGALDGDLYYFDLSSRSPAAWTVQKVFDGEPARPITSAPRIFGDTATGKPIIVFGTGRLLTMGDTRDDSQQAIAGVRLQLESAPPRYSDLVERTLSRTTLDSFVVSGAPLTTEAGWLIELGSDARDVGERVISAPGAHFSSGSFLVNTQIPNSGDPCVPQLRGNLYLFNASTGLASSLGVIGDTDGDRDVDVSDEGVGVVLRNSVPGGTPVLIESVGGGGAAIPDYPGIRIPTPTWRRRNHGELEP